MKNTNGWEPMGTALLDYHRGARDGVLLITHDLGGTDELPVSYFFRNRDGMNSVEQAALSLSRGRVLDLGAGVGSHALALQAQGHSVVALDSLPEAVEIMTDRGVSDARVGSWWELNESETFDTALLMMNGAGLAGSLEGMSRLLVALEETLAPGGQILMDSVNLPEVMEAPHGEDGVPYGEDGRYPGELQYQFEYAGRRGDPIPLLFLDFNLLSRLCAAGGLRAELVTQVEDVYLAVIRREGSARAP